MILKDAQASHALGQAISACLAPGDVMTLSGPLGAGKTSIARGLIEGLGFSGEVPSPSFPIILPYEPPLVRLPIWHVDLYRLDDSEEIGELGLDEILNDGVLALEWPERLGSVRWSNMLELSLDILPEGARRLTVVIPPSWEDRWPFQ